MKVILLAAGFGTRLLPLTGVIPKCLVPINGRPLLEYWLRALDDADLPQVLINTHYLPEIVRQWFDNTPWAQTARLMHEPKILGTGGTLLANRDFIGDDPTMLVHADNLCAADLTEFVKAHRKRTPGTVMTMMSFRSPTPETCGILELDDNGVVQAFHEKTPNPPGNLANAAVYIVEPEVIDYIATLNEEEIDFSTHVIPHFIGRIQTWENEVYHRDIGNIDSLLLAQTENPLDPTAPQPEQDSWCKLCRHNNKALIGEMATALAESLDIPLYNDNEGTQSDSPAMHLLLRPQSEAPQTNADDLFFIGEASPVEAINLRQENSRHLIACVSTPTP